MLNSRDRNDEWFELMTHGVGLYVLNKAHRYCVVVLCRNNNTIEGGGVGWVQAKSRTSHEQEEQ